MALAAWSFTPLPAFAPTVFPNIAMWNVSNAAKNLTYQIEISWPFEWPSREVTGKFALTMYVIDGNALGMTASEGFKRRKPVDTAQRDSVVVSIGYPLTDSVYSFSQRAIDFRPPLPIPQTPPSGADDFIEFIDDVLRPWALLANLRLFDTFFSASPALNWNNGSILDEVSRRLGSPTPLPRKDEDVQGQGGCDGHKDGNGHGIYPKPAFFIGYGSLEQFPVKRRTETEVEFLARKTFFQTTRMTKYCHELYDRVRANGKTRDVVLKEYLGQDHARVGGSALTDGIDFFVDW